MIATTDNDNESRHHSDNYVTGHHYTPHPDTGHLSVADLNEVVSKLLDDGGAVSGLNTTLVNGDDDSLSCLDQEHASGTTLSVPSS